MFSIPRGFMEMHILKVLQTPHHGYEIMKHIEQECVYWKPSPGSVYPLLRKLKKGGLITEKKSGKRNVYTLTKSGIEQIKKFDSCRKEIKEKMIALFRMMGEDNATDEFKNGFDIFNKIHKDPVKRKRAAKLREDFHRQLKALAEE